MTMFRTARSKVLLALAAVVAIFTMATPAYATGTNTLKAGSTMTAGGTFTLATDCTTWINDSTPSACGTFSGTPNVNVTAATSLSGTVNTTGSTITVNGPFTVTLSTGPCQINITNSKVLTYNTGTGTYDVNTTIGAYTFGSCPNLYKVIALGTLGASPSSSTFAASWTVT